MRRRRFITHAALAAVAAPLAVAPSAHAALTSNTPVATGSGQVAISQVPVGGSVLGWIAPSSWGPTPVVFSAGTGPGTQNEMVYVVAGDRHLIGTFDQIAMRADGTLARLASLQPGDQLRGQDGSAQTVQMVAIGLSTAGAHALALTGSRPTTDPSGHVFSANSIAVGDYALQLGFGGSMAAASQRTTPISTTGTGARRTAATRTRFVPFHLRSTVRLAARGTCIEQALTSMRDGEAGEGARVAAAVAAGCAAPPTVRLYDRTRLAAHDRVVFDVACPSRYRLLSASVIRYAGRLRGVRRKTIDDHAVLLTATTGGHGARVTVEGRCTSAE